MNYQQPEQDKEARSRAIGASAGLGAGADDDESMGDMWRAIKAERQEKRANNRKSSPDLLREAGVQFVAKNGDAHLIVRTDGGHTVDFWPGTGLWIMRGSTQRHRGVRKLIKFCRPENPHKALTR